MVELPACRYEVQGEYVIPSVAAIPKSAAEMALMQGAGGQGAASGQSPFEQADGRWRVQVSPDGCSSSQRNRHV